MIFPFKREEDEGLSARDFQRLEIPFNRTVCYFLPCEGVEFLAPDELQALVEGGERPSGAPWPETWLAGATIVLKERRPVVGSDGRTLYLPVWHNEAISALAVLSSGAMVKYADYSPEWLHERSRLISREFRKIKQWSWDRQTGLLSGQHLREDLESLLTMLAGQRDEEPQEKNNRPHWALFLIEIFPKAKNSDQAMTEIARAGACLNSFLGESAPVHHFGCGLFGMLWNGDGLEEFRLLGQALLRKLKRQNFARIHMGIEPVALPEPTDAATNCRQGADRILEQTWNSLATARKRGPYAIRAAVDETAGHTFRKPQAPTLNRFRRLWRGEERFSIALVKRDFKEGGAEFPDSLTPILEPPEAVLPENAREAYIFLPGLNHDQALCRMEKFKKDAVEQVDDTFSIGLASFPCGDFTRTETTVNCRKALIHTTFFGPDTTTPFDGVSLNISGDHYYKEGDLAGAVREYRLGLRLEPENINLLNSLGVIHAQLNRYHLAIPIFEKALSIDSTDFMAMFNLGFAHLRRNRRDEALVWFEKALEMDQEYFDLLLQLGQLYCQLGRFQEAHEILLRAEQSAMGSDLQARPWERSNEHQPVESKMGHGQVYRFLGEACMGIGQDRQATTYLQRASRYNSRDAAALSMLGELYLRHKEGSDIALSLCQEAVEIDPGQWRYWLRLALIQEEEGLLSEALVSAKRAMSLDRKTPEIAEVKERVSQTLANKKRKRK